MRPYVLVMAAAAVDGRIASRTRYSRLSCPHDLRRLHEARASVDAVLIGAGTAMADNPRLTVRYAQGRNPARVLVDGALRVPLDLRLFDRSAPTMVFTTSRAPREKVEELRRLGVEVVVAEGERVDMAHVMRELARRGFSRVLVEGGGTVIWQVLDGCLADELVVTVTPYLLGAGVSLAEGPGYERPEEAPYRLELAGAALCSCGNEVVLRYRVHCK